MMHLPAAVTHSWKTNRPLTFVGLLSVILLLVCLVGMVVDNRMVTGMPAWDKPAKFAISFLLYSFTLIWMLGFIEGKRARLARIVSALTAVGAVVELLIITAQAARGTTSHFNVGASLDATLYYLMGGFVLLIWLMNLLAAALLLLQPLPDRAFAWSLRLGLVLTLIGGSIGAVMTAPTSAQLGQDPPTVVGAHSVGGTDGGPGLRFLGWSTTHGDLRVSHFVGLHALQAGPLLFWLVGRRRSWTARQRVGLVWTAAGAYLGLITLLFWQAQRGQSVIAPDSLTLSSAGMLLLLTAISAGLVLRPDRRLTQETI
ncbi:hypothetical protein [Deinococcus marmoris]|uniref:hypothetical protein n=1 Tax=Deinococcus marmoris TaxID=249408 RepID=UPI000690D086|nr:hypothetical protein [Deinococcus marmoris]